MPRALAAAIAWTLASVPPLASADGGTMRLFEPSGSLIVAIFSAPEPLRVGAADLSVLVLDRADNRPVLDADVTLEAVPPAASQLAPERLEATHAQATNKLLYATPFTPGTSGDWKLHALVRHGGDTAEVSCLLPVVAGQRPLARIWPYLALPPAAVALYALRAWLAARGVRTSGRRGLPPARAASEKS